MPVLKESTKRLKQKTLINLYKKNNGNQAEMSREMGISPQAMHARLHNPNMGIQERLAAELDRIGFSVEDFLAIVAKKVMDSDCKDHPKYCNILIEIIEGLKATTKVDSTVKHALTLTPDEEIEYKSLRNTINNLTPKDQLS